MKASKSCSATPRDPPWPGCWFPIKACARLCPARWRLAASQVVDIADGGEEIKFCAFFQPHPVHEDPSHSDVREDASAFQEPGVASVEFTDVLTDALPKAFAKPLKNSDSPRPICVTCTSTYLTPFSDPSLSISRRSAYIQVLHEVLVLI